MEIRNENNGVEPGPDITMLSPEVQLLGSVTSISEGPEMKGQQLRSSARVFKKMKMDVSVPLAPEKIEKKEEHKPDTKKCFRPLWTSDDKSLFFEALNEYGKDFENIHLYISNKFRKKGVPDHLIKTKDQVRHLYYRTWHKISKYLTFADGIKKIAQELYALINYGELRKKIGSVSKKILPKLKELVYKGSLMVRLRGKQVRVKTPMCKALRKLNQLDEKYDEIRLPNRLTVELRPKDMTSFFKVQSTAQNPRLKTSLLLQKRLGILIECLEKKWKSVDARIYDKALVFSRPVTNECLPPDKVIEVNKTLLNPPLRLTPPANCRIEVPSINLGEYFTQQNICLSTYENRVGITNYSTSCKYNDFKLINKSGSRKGGARSRIDSISDKSEKSPQKNSSHTDDNDTCDNEINAEGDKGADELQNVVDKVKQEFEEVTVKEVKLKEIGKVNVQEEIANQKKERINTIRKGWTQKDCQSLTIGEVYLMFGSDSKLILEYSWDNPIEVLPKTETNINMELKLEEEMDTSNIISQEQPKNLDLSESLSKLLSVAKLHYRKNIIKCPCGHVCGVKNNAQLKKAMETKIRKILTDIDKCTEEVEDKITTEENMFESTTFTPPPAYVQPKIAIPPPYFQQRNTENTPMVKLVSQIDSIQRLSPKYCNRKGRKPRSKQVVVERKLPLLPNNIESEHQIVRMNIISQEETSIGTGESVFENRTGFNNQPVTDMAGETIRNSPPCSPSRILKEEDNQWISSEVEDYSLSSLLGRLESPMKPGTSNSSIMGDDSRLSQDVDAQLHSMLTQSSIDFSANFADLAAQVVNDSKHN
ncbi:cramped chromatin regulator [Leptinotarsa decemlineata]|uniref:cramped chromatin regulator n=1 Tax=Leptinotarsa decemlineata TaxID=7539 RepID=UPI003D30424C